MENCKFIAEKPNFDGVDGCYVKQQQIVYEQFVSIDAFEPFCDILKVKPKII